MRQRRSSQRGFTAVYERDGVELARYSLTAPTQGDAENQADNLFYHQHPEISMFDETPGLNVRIEEH